jgi:LysM repeat protein
MRTSSLLLLILVVLTLPRAAAAQVPRVLPQEPGPDGGLVHVVQFGDTLDGIMNAYINYGVTVEQLLALNGWRFPPQFIFVDEQIIVLPPGTTEPGNGLPVPVDAAPPTAAPQAEQPTDLSETDETVTRGEAPPPAEVLSAADIQALSAMDVVAPFVPVLGDDSLIPAPPSPEVAQATEEAPPAADVAATLELIPTNTLIPESVPVATEEPIVATEEAVVPTEEMAATEQAVVPTEEMAATEQAIVPTEEPATLPETEVAAAPPLDLPAEMPDFTRNLGQICASFYDDINENGRRDADEVPLAGGMVLVGDGSSVTTDDTGSACLVDLGAGALQVQAAAPDGYGITSPDGLRVMVTSGQITSISFGASVGYQPPETLPTIEETLNAPVPEAFRTSSDAVQAETDESPLDQLFEVSGLIVLALGILTFSGGILLALWLRLVRR